MENKTNKKYQLINDLNHFTGTENYYRYHSVLLTDGAHYLADQAGAFWLMDIIWSYVSTKKWFDEHDFITCKLTVSNSVGKVVFDDGNDNILVTQEIPYTDFPLEKIQLYLGSNGHQFVVMLPSEY